jgi:hypothetical protein
MRLFHFSEDPNIEYFEPHVAPTSKETEALVWAIDEWHAPMYYTPRNCPRACFWPGERTTDDDRERWFGGVEGRMVMAIESAWLDRLRATTLYRYEMPAGRFESMGHAGGHWVARERIEPLGVEPVGDLLAAIAAADVELRITPSLIDLWLRVIESTLEFSGTRLRYAAGYERLAAEIARREGRA